MLAYEHLDALVRGITTSRMSCRAVIVLLFVKFNNSSSEIPAELGLLPGGVPWANELLLVAASPQPNKQPNIADHLKPCCLMTIDAGRTEVIIKISINKFTSNCIRYSPSPSTGGHHQAQETLGNSPKRSEPIRCGCLKRVQ